MLGVEQIRTLEGRIEKALSFIAGLRVENAALQTKAEASDEARGRAEERAVAAESRVRELEEAIAVFKRDQSRIEEGILHALEKLDAFEDLVLKGPPQAESSAVERVASMPEAAPLPTPSPAPAEDPTEADDLTALDGPGSHGEADREEDSVGVPAEEAFHGGQPATPRPEPAGTESKRPEPARTAAPQSAPDELGIF